MRTIKTQKISLFSFFSPSLLLIYTNKEKIRGEKISLCAIQFWLTKINRTEKSENLGEG